MVTAQYNLHALTRNSEVPLSIKGLFISLAGLLLGVLAGLQLLGLSPGGQQPRPTSVGTAAIGGPFVLVDQMGRARTDRDFRGKHMMVFFGFLYCPDICPATLQRVSEVVDQLGDKKDRITPLFITVDPERDTPEALAIYLANFSPRLVGLTGTPEQIKAAAKAYRAYYKKITDEKLPGAYTLDHSSILYVMGPDGRYVMHFTHGTTVSEMVQKLLAIL